MRARPNPTELTFNLDQSNKEELIAFVYDFLLKSSNQVYAMNVANEMKRASDYLEAIKVADSELSPFITWITDNYYEYLRP
jgi:ribosome-binding ATPase YchF (GTP1/OBG family)